MKIFKKTKASKDAKIAQGIRSFAAKIKIKKRIELANMWADRNKRRTSCITIGILLVSLVVGSWLTLTSATNETALFDSMAEIQPMFEGMHRIQRAKDLQVQQTTELTNKGRQLKRELDSLVALPVKTHKDSTDIVVKYRQLELVVKYLENK